MTLRATIAALRCLEKVATPVPVRVEVSHDLWVELAAGYGVKRRMVADCLTRPDADLFTAMRNALPAILDALDGCENSLQWTKANMPAGWLEPGNPVDAALAVIDKEG